MPIHVALVHHPTVDKTGMTTATSVTNLDLHDISRASRTYGVDGFWVVHPHQSMNHYVDKVMNFWKDGHGSTYNPTRREALETTYLVRDLGELAEELEKQNPDVEIAWVATSAKKLPNSISYKDMRVMMENPDEKRLFCVLFGTGWGLHPCVMEEMTYILDPIYGPSDWNHLSVRAAAGIILDRLRGH